MTKAASYDARQATLSRKDSGAKVIIPTPEGIPLVFTVAHSGDRAAGFFIDFFIQTVVTIVLVILLVLGFGAEVMSGGSWGVALVLLFVFLLQTFYFTWFELRWHGSTPGKRRSGTRVISRHGGPLTADAVIVRNFTRILEFTLPMQLLTFADQVWPTAPPWARLVAILWLIVIACLPMFNKQRLRVGDIVAGTIVVLAPRPTLLEDQSTRALAPTPYAPGRAAPTYEFTDKQLDVYGIFELQVLEEVLRKADAGGIHDIMALETVAEKIKVKIGWERERWRVDSERFLRDFYAALRARLEHRMLLGERKEDKHS